MQLLGLVGRSLRHHGRTSIAVALGVTAATAALAGALIVGDSMRESLREVAVGRLGHVDQALLADGFVRTQLASDWTDRATSVIDRAAPAIILNGGAAHADSGRRAERISVFGVDEAFWLLAGDSVAWAKPALDDREIVINQRLASDLGASTGDDVLLRVGKPSAVATETLLGRRDDTTATLRLRVKQILPDSDIAAFSMSPRQFVPANAFVPAATLQRAIGRRDRINAVLLHLADGDRAEASADGDQLATALRNALTLDDLGLSLRVDDSHGYVALESESFLIEPAIESAAMHAGNASNLNTTRVLTYLANSIARVDGASNAAAIPYSTVTALDKPGAAVLLHDDLPPGAPPLSPGEIVLNEWAAHDLDATLGDEIELTYYVTDAFDALRTETYRFQLRAIVGLQGAAADRGFTPTYPGITDTRNIADWNPPFPVDLSRVRPNDDDYWADHGPMPKAFVTLADGERLWTHDAERFGRLTSVRFYLPAGNANTDVDLSAIAARLQADMLAEIDPAAVGLRIMPLRRQAVTGSGGSTDFGGLFIGFSFFLIGSAAMLVALLFRLGVERRAREVGLLLATGFPPRRVAMLFLAEGGALAVAGSLVGCAAAVGYGALMLAGLRSWWSSAVNAPFLQLHVKGASLAIGIIAGCVVAWVSIAWSIRGIARRQPRLLLAGAVGSGRTSKTPGRFAAILLPVCTIGAVALLIAATWTDAVPISAGFFGGGSLLLVASLAGVRIWLARPQVVAVDRPGQAAIIKLGVRNAPRNAGRSLMTAALIASASFVIVALQAFHMQADADPSDRNSGTGGFTLWAESALPLHYDFNNPTGRDSLGVSTDTAETLNDVHVQSFRLRAGDEAGCVNLYLPTQPRILGATQAMIERGGFQFAGSLATDDAERENPWRLLDKELPDGVTPAIGDEAAVMWQLHLGLGKDLIIKDDRGRPATLRFVALLRGSTLQDEVIVAESAFTRLFPGVEGYSFFLIECTPHVAGGLRESLERDLSRYGFDAGLSVDRLNDFLAVQNTYLSTFQTLGGLGLVLGTFGLAAVVLRNVWERRGELALMRALGFPRNALGRMVFAENAAIVLAGLAAGVVPAVLAVSPQIISRPDAIPWASLVLTLIAVLVVGLGAGAIALAPTLRTPMLPALRSE